MRERWLAVILVMMALTAPVTAAAGSGETASGGIFTWIQGMLGEALPGLNGEADTEAGATDESVIVWAEGEEPEVWVMGEPITSDEEHDGFGVIQDSDAPDENAAAENLLFNPDFELLGEDGLPEGWDISAYRMGGSATDYWISEFAASGEWCARIDSYEANDARFCQVAEVRPNSLYRLSGWICAEGVETTGVYTWGANLSVINGNVADARTTPLTDTDGEWVYVEMYGLTGPDQTEVTVCARLGGYSGDATGTAWFDDLCLEELEALPDSVSYAVAWYDTSAEIGGNSGSGRDSAKQNGQSFIDSAQAGDDQESGEPVSIRGILYVAALVWVLLGAMLLFLLGLETQRTRMDPLYVKKQSPHLPWWTVFILLVALGVRLLVATQIEGYAVDIGCFTAWGSRMAEVGPTRFYTDGYFCDYPPGYMLVLGLNYLIGSQIPIADIQVLMVKLPPMIADLIIAWLIGEACVRRGKSRGFGALAATLFALNPALILNSAGWGQIDSVLCLLLLIVVLLALHRQWIALIPVYVLAVLIKPQALMAGPLGLAVLVTVWIRDRSARWKMLVGLGAALTVAAAILIPFSIHMGGTDGENTGWFSWIIEKYTGTMSSYDYATINAANLYYLFDLNWVKVGNAASMGPCLTMAAVSAGWAVFLALRDRRNGVQSHPAPRAVLLGFGLFFTVCGVFGGALRAGDGGTVLLTTGVAGYGAVALCVFISCHLWLRSGEVTSLPVCGALAFLLIFNFSTMMHERYVMPAIVLLGLACAIRSDWRLWLSMLLLTATLFLNEGVVLDNNLVGGASYGHLWPDTQVLAKGLACFNLLCAGLCMWAACDQCSGHWESRLFPTPAGPALPPAGEQAGQTADASTGCLPCAAERGETGALPAGPDWAGDPAAETVDGHEQGKALEILSRRENRARKRNPGNDEPNHSAGRDEKGGDRL